MKFKYLSISGESIESITDNTKDQLIKGFIERGITISMTPVIEIDSIPFWNENTLYGKMTKEQWIKRICPQLVKIYG
jgi:hypothetical protein